MCFCLLCAWDLRGRDRPRPRAELSQKRDSPGGADLKRLSGKGLRKKEELGHQEGHRKPPLCSPPSLLSSVPFNHALLTLYVKPFLRLFLTSLRLTTSQVWHLRPYHGFYHGVSVCTYTMRTVCMCACACACVCVCVHTKGRGQQSVALYLTF